MRTFRLFILIVAVFGAGPVHAQAPLLPVSAVVSASRDAEADTQSVKLLVGRSTLVDINSPIARVSLTSADVADAMVTGPSQLLVHGKVPGTISMFVWDRSGGIRRYEVMVQRDLARLNEQIRQLFPGETVEAQSSGKSVVLSGLVSNKDMIERLTNVAAGYVEKKDDVVTLLQIREGGASNQVLLRVRFAEVNRSALTELGSSFFTQMSGYKDYVARSTTQQYAAPDFDWKNGGLVFSDYLNLFLFNSKEGLGAVIKALSTKGLFQSLAEPNLVAESGKEASFLAGGEIPIPVAQGSGGSVSISVQYKEFGVRLNFLPVVNGDRIHLKVRPEVSTLDFNNAVVLNGFRIPALSTRRTETELELQNGQTFAIAGLMNNTVNSSMRKIPGIGDIPILGLLFQSKAAQKEQTELVVMITPEILPNNSTGVTSRLPLTPERFMEPLPSNRLHEQPAPAFNPNGASRSGDTGTPRPSSEMSSRLNRSQGTQSSAVQTAPAPAPAPAAAAAATVAGLNPMARAVVDDSASTAVPAAAPAATATPAAAPAATTVTRPVTDQDKKVLERQRKQEEQARAAAAKTAARQAAIDREKQKKDAAVAAEQAKRQAKIDAEAQRIAAEQAKREAENEKKRQKAQAAADAKRQQTLKEAEEKLKAAQATYQLEVSKTQK
jgi:pilus assembly protein CpaC